MKGASAMRAVAWGIALLLVALPLIGLLQGWFAAERWPVRHLKLEAEFSHVSADQIRAAVTPDLADGFFALNLSQVQHVVARLPWVQRVEARKRWPDTLLLRVYEQQPFAHWNGGRLLNHSGDVFQVARAAGLQGLPNLSGPENRREDVIRFYAQALRNCRRASLRLEAVSLSDRGSWTLVLASGSRIVLGRDAPHSRLDRFIDVYPRLIVGHPRGFVYADLRYTNGFAVRWPEVQSAAPINSGEAPKA